MKRNWLIGQIVHNDKWLRMTNCIKRNISDRGLPVTCSSVHEIGEVPGFHTPVCVSFLSSKAVGRRAVFAWTPGGFKKCARFGALWFHYLLETPLTRSELHVQFSVACSLKQKWFEIIAMQPRGRLKILLQMFLGNLGLE